jgi:hypothetical protein
MVFVDQQAHEFGDGDGRVGVVELDGEFFVEEAPGCRVVAGDAHHVLQ